MQFHTVVPTSKYKAPSCCSRGVLGCGVFVFVTQGSRRWSLEDQFEEELEGGTKLLADVKVAGQGEFLCTISPLERGCV